MDRPTHILLCRCRAATSADITQGPGFDQCDGDPTDEAPGVYGGSTFSQGDPSTPAPHPPGATSNCQTFTSVGGNLAANPMTSSASNSSSSAAPSSFTSAPSSSSSSATASGSLQAAIVSNTASASTKSGPTSTSSSQPSATSGAAAQERIIRSSWALGGLTAVVAAIL